MTRDPFLALAYTFSRKSAATKQTYQRWVTRCCQAAHTPHVLDLTPAQIQPFYASLADRQYALSTRNIVRAALVYTFTVLLRSEVPESMRCSPEQAQAVAALFHGRRRHAATLPEVVSKADIRTFFQALPRTNAREVIWQSYQTGQKAQDIQIGCKRYALGYLQQLCARAGRQVGLPHGFGLRGVRASGIVHRIQARQSDRELKQIMEDTGLSYSQFLLYRKAAGDFLQKSS